MGCDIKHGHCSVRSHLEGLIQCKLAASHGGLFDAECAVFFLFMFMIPRNCIRGMEDRLIHV